MSSRLLADVWAAVLPLLLLGPALGPGYVLSYDMVWVPDLSLRSDFLGLGTALPRAVPSDAVVSLLDEVVPGAVLQKLVLYGALLLAGLGYARLVGRSPVARLTAVSLAVWSPFVVERLGIGHWPVLLGYGVLPWLVLAGRRIRAEHRVPLGVWFLLPLGSLSASAGLLSAVVLLVSATGRQDRLLAGTGARLAAGCLAVNAPWWVAGLLHAGDATSVGGADVFALHGEGTLPAPLAALGLGGIWNIEVVPASRQGLLAWVALAVLIAVAAAGARPWWRREGDGRLVALWVLGYVLAVATWASPTFVDWCSAHVPGSGLLRDGARALALCVPLVVSLVAAGVETLVGRVPSVVPRVGLAVACVVFPVALMADAAWGLGGALAPARYPPSYAEARQALTGATADVLVLPFSSYRAPAWNRGRKVLDPVGRYLPPNYVVDDELVVGDTKVAGEDPRVPQVVAALALPGPDERASALGRLGIGYVVRDAEAPGAGDPALDPTVAGRTLLEGSGIEVVQVAADVRLRTSSVAARTGMSLAWAGFAGILLVGLVRLSKHVLAELVVRGRSDARVRR